MARKNPGRVREQAGSGLPAVVAQRFVAALLLAFAVTLLLARPARAQTIAPVDAREAARFDNVVRASAGAGYSMPLVVGHGSGAADALFVLLATRDGQAVLVGVSEPRASAELRAVELEHAETAAQIAVHGVHFTGFLNTSDLYDLVVTHEPFTTGVRSRFDTHYVLRRRSGNLEVACEFPGDATSSSSRDTGTSNTTRRVTIERVPRATPLTFAVHTAEALSDLAARQPNTGTTPWSETIREYELPAAAACRER
jgi:hypothetical protein